MSPYSSSSRDEISEMFPFPSQEERLKIKSDAVKRLEPKISSIINSIEKEYVADVKEPELASYSVQSNNELTGLEYNANSNFYDV